MPKQIMMDQIHLSFFAPENLPKPALTAIWRTLQSPQLGRQLRLAIRGVLRRHAALRQVRWTLR